MLPKALELCAEVRSLGASLLSALEKSDAEALSMLRATQETALMKAVRNVKQQQLNEANSNLDALNDTLAITQARQQYYQSLLSAGLSSYEKQQISLLNQAQTFQFLSQQALTFGSAVAAIPDETAGTVAPFPLASVEFGGRQLAAIADFVGGGFGMLASMSSGSANITGLQGGWDRRSQDWQFQLQTATLEIQQINDQIKAANARVSAAQADLDNQDLQISNSSDVEDFLRTKYTNQALYDWMVGQVSSVYFQCYQTAYDLAKRAEACFIFERMPDLSNYTSFIQFGYWDSLKKGLLSGERLYQDLKRLEIAYMDQNQVDVRKRGIALERPYGRLKVPVLVAKKKEFHDYQRFGKKTIARRYQDDPESGTELVANVILLEELRNPDVTLFSIGQPTPPEQRLQSLFVSQATIERAAEGQPALAWPPVQSGKTTGLLSMYVSVDRQGHVREAYPLNSDNAGLEDAARDQLLKWKLKPMAANGVPVQAEAPLTFRFETTLASNAVQPTGQVSSASTASGAVPPLRVQVSPGVLQGFLVDHPAPMYPPEAKQNHIQGKVVLALTNRQDRGYERYSHAHFPGSGAHGFRCRCRESLALPTVPVERFPCGSSIDCRGQLHTSVIRYSTRTGS